MKDYFKRKLYALLDLFMRITAGIVLTGTAYIYIFWGRDAEIGVHLLLEIMLCAFLCALSCFIYPDEWASQLSKGALLVRIILHYVIINVIVLGCGACFSWYHASDWKMLLGMEATIAVVFCVVFIKNYIEDKRMAKELNDRLKNRSAHDS